MFYIVSRGSTATHWLAKNLSKHKDLVCFYSSRSFPPVEPGKGYPGNRDTWIKDDLEASKFIESLKRCEEATHNSKIFGSIHGYHTLDMKKIVEEKNGTFKYMVRSPLEMVHSAFIIYCYRYLNSINIKIANEDVHDYVCENLKNLKLKDRHFKVPGSPKPHFLKNFIGEENFLLLKKTKNFFKDKYNLIKPKKKLYWGYEKDLGDINENILNLFSGVSRDFLNLQNLYFSKWGIEKALVMDKIFSDKNYFRNLILDLAPNSNVSDEYLNEIYSSINLRVNVHRKKPMKNQEILESLPNCMREIFQYYFETFRIQRLCDAFEFNFKIK